MVDRSAFLYLEPDDGDEYFAQCSDCCFFNGQQCAIIGLPVPPDASCGFFIDGPYDRTPVKKRVTPKEAGFVVEEVRCENCRFFVKPGNRCGLYLKLNNITPKQFDLDALVKPKGCCNAFTPKE